MLAGILAKKRMKALVGYACMLKLISALMKVARIYQRDDLFNGGLLTNGSRTLANGVLNFEKATRHKKYFLY